MLEFNATFLIAMFSFVVFIFIMNAIFYNPILGIIKKREEYISSNYEDAKQFTVSAQDFRDTHRAKIEQTQNRCRHEFKKAVSNAHKNANEKIQEAKEQTKKLVQEEKDKLISGCDELKNEVKSVVIKDLASSIVSKVLDEDHVVENIDYNSVNRIIG